jgi:hypothetical protein
VDSPQPRKTNTAFEYFLYAAILAETGLAALIYKVIFRNPELLRLRIYFAVFYFAFLGWAIAQLHLLHRDRTAEDTPAAAEPQPEPIPQAASTEDTRPALGLTVSQLVIVVVVFATAIATFSWALRLLG